MTIFSVPGPYLICNRTLGSSLSHCVFPLLWLHRVLSHIFCPRSGWWRVDELWQYWFFPLWPCPGPLVQPETKFQDYSWIQDFEAGLLTFDRASLKSWMLHKYIAFLIIYSSSIWNYKISLSDESFKDYSWIQDFEADFLWKVFLG